HRRSAGIAAGHVALLLRWHREGLEPDLVTLEENAGPAQREQRDERTANRTLVAVTPARREARVVVARRMPERNRAVGHQLLCPTNDLRELARQERRVQKREIHAELQAVGDDVGHQLLELQDVRLTDQQPFGV